jgi:formylglycine-generating enzyme required for sulfatase activity
MSRLAQSSLVNSEQFSNFIREGRYFRPEYWDRDVRHQFRQAQPGHKIVGGDEILRRIGFRWNTRLLPVTGVSWYEADAYCRSVGGRLPWSYELATQSEDIAEWCADWFNSKAQIPNVNPEPPLRRRVANWPDAGGAVPELTSGSIGFRVLPVS